MPSIHSTDKPVLYQTKSGAIELKEDLTKETVWATQAQIAEIFDIERSVATKHINKIFKDEEVDQKSNVQKMHIPNSDKPVSLYSLDVILSVGYRTNSSQAIKFRQWSTSILKKRLRVCVVFAKSGHFKPDPNDRRSARRSHLIGRGKQPNGQRKNDRPNIATPKIAT